MSKKPETPETPETPKKREVIAITPPNIVTAVFRIIGFTHLCVHRFSAKAQEDIAAIQAAGSQARSKTKREAKNFSALFEAARYRAAEGWDGVNASCFRNAMISACRLVGFKMVLAKLAIFIEADGHDKIDGTPLVRIESKNGPSMWIGPGRNANGSFDLRSRPRWNPYEWSMTVRVKFDADQFSTTDITNLLARVGKQVGICEGRPDSRESPGIGYGLFEVESLNNEGRITDAA